MSSPGTTSTTRPAAQGDPSCATLLHFLSLGPSPSLHFQYSPLSVGTSSLQRITPKLFNRLFHPSFSTFSLVQYASMLSLTYKNKENWAKLSPVWISLGEVGRGWNGAPRMKVSLRLIRSKLQQLILHSFLLPGLGTRTPPT